jgi:hypothetical protein
MNIVGDRKFVEIPGDAMLELPPLLVHGGAPARMDRVMDMASRVVEEEDLVPGLPLDEHVDAHDVERRKLDMALTMVDSYLGLVRHWHWGDGIVEWIKQCETTFELRADLRRLLRPDVWPHAGRSSFVRLLEDKAVLTSGVDIERAVGLRLTFRHAPPIGMMSDQFLFYLNGKLANTAYHAWSGMNPEPISSLPPERFRVEVVTM